MFNSQASIVIYNVGKNDKLSVGGSIRKCL